MFGADGDMHQALEIGVSLEVSTCDSLYHKPLTWSMTMNHNDAAVKQTVINMINEIGLLRKLVAIDSMPYKLQQARLLLRELYAEYEEREHLSAHK
jgi:hypothetical protein